MNILFFSQAAWDDKNSFGNTVSNIFGGDVWNKDNFVSFYTRKQTPDNKFGILYYNLSAVDIIKGLLKGQIKGVEFSTRDIQESKNNLYKFETEKKSQTKEKVQIDKLHQNKNEFIYWGHEAVWRTRVWLNKYFETFLKKNNPDILFAFATSPYILWPLIKYLKKHTKCKVVLLVADDVYGSYDRCAIYRRNYLKRDLKKCICAADKLYGISDSMSELYQQRFGKPVETLYKGCDLSTAPKMYVNNPLRFIYAGNLLWGRSDTLSHIADSLDKLNQDGLKAVLEIYTGATVTEELRKKLDKNTSSHIMGSRSYKEIKQIMHDADVVLHIESFDKDNIETVRYSFSTKIIDCLQSGNQVLGIGPKGIASIEYLKKVDGAIVVDDQNNIFDVIQHIVLHSDELNENRKLTREYAKKRHEINAVQQSIRKDFEKLM